MMLSNGKVAPMPNKLTDNEIIKALEVCCTKRICKECIYLGNKEFCIADNTIAVLDLINRLQAQNDRDIKVKVEALYKVNDLKLENERLKEINEKLLIDFNGLSGVIKRAKAEAYKEFAERLKRRLLNKNEVINNTIDNLLKEVIGE